MYLDLSATFDCVQHGILKQKLKFYGLDKGMLDWLVSYLDGRSGYVVIGSSSSNIRSSPQGVPQGSVLGPLLYLLYINELLCLMEQENCTKTVHEDRSLLFSGYCTHCGTFTMFADDGQFQFASKSRRLNQEMLEETFWTF